MPNPPKKSSRNVVKSRSDPPTLRPNFRPVVDRHARTLPTVSGRTGRHILYFNPQGAQALQSLPTAIPVPPVNLFPFEILMEIFRFCLPEETFIAPNRRTAPLLLCLVCWHWRQIALSVPTLWSSLLVQAGYRIGTPSLSVIKFWIGRTGKVPLSLAISQTTRPDDEQYEYTESVLRLFVPLLPRWKAVQFRFESEQPQHALLESLRPTGVNAPILEFVSLEIHKWADVDLRELFTKLFQLSPNLRRFTWNREPRQSTFQGILWQQLTHVDITHWLSPPECLDILDQCENVEELSINGLVWRVSVSWPETKVLSRLRCFTLCSQFDMSPIFDHLTLPALRELRIEPNIDRKDGERLGWESLRRLLDRSSCDLEKFVVVDLKLPESEIQDLMSLPFPSSLKELWLGVSFDVGEEMRERFMDADRYPDLRVVVLKKHRC